MDQAGEWVRTGVVVGLALISYFIVVKVGSRFVERVALRGPEAASRARTLWLVVRRVLQAILIIFVVLMVFTIWGLSLAPFIAIGTVVAAAVGFGAQSVVKDVLYGFFILAEDQYQIGDSVSIGGVSGTVEDIQFRVTVLRDVEGSVHYVSNGQIAVASNFTKIYARPVIDISIAYDQDPDRALEVMLDELTRLADDAEIGPLLRGPAEVLGVQDFGETGILIRGRLNTTAHERSMVRREALLRVKKRFDAEGIRFSAAKDLNQE
jgi:small conductance mechanosensitive channel